MAASDAQSSSAQLLALESVELFIRNVRTRIPFRYGKACLLACPLLHVRVKARSDSGDEAVGVSADALPPKWFDKSPEKDFQRNVEDLLTAVKIGTYQYLEIGSVPRNPFDIWLDAYPNIMQSAEAAGLNELTGSFGSSMLERAVIDAAGKLAGMDFHTMVRSNRLGIQPERAHLELEGARLTDVLPEEPADFLHIRHTVGLADPILDDDISPEDRVDDGLPQSLERWVQDTGLSYFKVKITGNIEQDAPRLEHIANVLDRLAPRDYRLSLDGNEQFQTPEALSEWLGIISSQPPLQPLLTRVLFIEQPLERSVALSEKVTRGFGELHDVPPVIIDESDGTLDAFKASVDLGYQGVSVKNCKGVFKGLMNAMLVARYNQERSAGYLLSGEDLINLPVVPLQQDLCTLSTLGVTQAERNGHHYFRGLEHLSQDELDACLDKHGSLYESWNGTACLKIRDGRVDLRSLRQQGYGVGIPIDFESMTPAEDWAFESLGLEGL